MQTSWVFVLIAAVVAVAVLLSAIHVWTNREEVLRDPNAQRLVALLGAGVLLAMMVDSDCCDDEEGWPTYNGGEEG